MQRTFQHWIATKWPEIDKDNLRIKFSALNVDFSSPSPDFLGSRRPAQAGVKDSYPPPLKSGYFTAIILCSVKTVADRYRHVAYHNKHWWQAFEIYQHRWPWMTLNRQKGVLVNFLQFLNALHISTLNCDEMAGDRRRQPAYEIFSIKRRFQQSKSRPSRFKEAGAGRRQRQLLKSGYFTRIISCSVKTVADRYRHAAYHNKHL